MSASLIDPPCANCGLTHPSFAGCPDPSMPPQEVLDSWAKDCRDGCGITCGDRPCAACCAGGVCDASPCACEDSDEDDCRHEWSFTGGDSYHGEGRIYCMYCGADGDA